MVKSHPSRVRGLKREITRHYQVEINVAPFTGAWIVMEPTIRLGRRITVAPSMGAWIETKKAQ